MIGGGRILAREDGVADVGGGRGEAARRRPRSSVGRPARASAGGAVEPPAVRGRGAALGIVGQAAAGAGIGAAGIAVRRGQRGGDVGAGAEAGIDQAVAPAAGRAPRHRARPLATGPAAAPSQRDAEPAQILEDPVDELGPAAAGVEILDPQQESPPLAAPGMAERGGIGMAEVQPAGRRGGEAGGDHRGPAHADCDNGTLDGEFADR